MADPTPRTANGSGENRSGRAENQSRRTGSGAGGRARQLTVFEVEPADRGGGDDDTHDQSGLSDERSTGAWRRRRRAMLTTSARRQLAAQSIRVLGPARSHPSRSSCAHLAVTIGLVHPHGSAHASLTSTLYPTVPSSTRLSPELEHLSSNRHTGRLFSHDDHDAPTPRTVPPRRHDRDRHRCLVRPRRPVRPGAARRRGHRRGRRPACRSSVGTGGRAARHRSRSPPICRSPTTASGWCAETRRAVRTGRRAGEQRRDRPQGVGRAGGASTPSARRWS